MCGFVGFVDFEKDISQNTKILENMNNCLAKRGPDEEGCGCQGGATAF